MEITTLSVLPPENPELPATFAIQAVGARFAPDTPAEIVHGTGQQAANGMKQCAFVLADALNHSVTHLGGTLSQWSELTGMDERALENLSNLGKKIPLERRSVSLSLDHHKVIATAPDGQQEFWINEAEQKGLSRGALRRSLLTGETQLDGKGAPSDRGQDNVSAHATKIRTIVQRFKSKGVLDEASPDQLLALHRDLLPVLAAHGEIVKRLMRTADRRALSALGADMRALVESK
ncbi:hypothetical protein [Verrucomicrobium sp. BvORR106]|uniref:hypothetical protein n=1 Tax=Verrucomicrobium sp. BvORR106 TaxID=1403819 RepID=UPI0006922F81|nr:hypothetical protein [Verrucomicrobium sp. BvORR106]